MLKTLQTLYFTLFCFLLLTQLTHAFNLKSLLFGDSSQDDNSQPSPLVSFGKPLPDHSRSSRSDISCSKYLCEDTDQCVDTPVDCPCRLVTDKKCVVGNWYVCINGDELCEDL